MVSWGLDLANKGGRSILFAPSKTILHVVDSHGALSVLVLEDDNKLLVTVRQLNLAGHDTWDGNLGHLVSICDVKDLDAEGRGRGKEVLGVLGHIDALAGVVDLE